MLRGKQFPRASRLLFYLVTRFDRRQRSVEQPQCQRKALQPRGDGSEVRASQHRRAGRARATNIAERRWCADRLVGASGMFALAAMTARPRMPPPGVIAGVTAP